MTTTQTTAPKREMLRHSQAWYHSATSTDWTARRIVEEVIFNHAAPGGGTYGEAVLRWYDFGDNRPPALRLEAFDDCWSALGPDIAAFMATNARGSDEPSLTPDEAMAALAVLGYADVTPTVDPYAKSEARS